MLSIRLQRTGRSGHAQYRVVAQDSRFSPTSGRYAAQLGTYNPHSKALNINVELAQKLLDNGAQPSERVAVLLKQAGAKLPSWVTVPEKHTSAVKNTDKLRRHKPVEEKAPVVEEVVAEAEVVEEPAVEEVAAPASE